MFCGSGVQSVSAQAKVSSNLEKIKAKVNNCGTGENAKVVLKMKDGGKMRGHIAQVGAGSFDLTISGTQRTATVPYAEVAQVKKQGWSNAAKLALGAGIGAGVTIAIVGGMLAKGLGDFCPLGCTPK